MQMLERTNRRTERKKSVVLPALKGDASEENLWIPVRVSKWSARALSSRSFLSIAVKTDRQAAGSHTVRDPLARFPGLRRFRNLPDCDAGRISLTKAGFRFV